MPIYAYRCDSCGHALDVLQKLSDPLLKTCPSCGKPTFSKQVTAAGFQLKGSGWYVTDFKGNPPSAKQEAAKPEEAAAPDATKPAKETAAAPDTTVTSKAEASTPESTSKGTSSTPAAAGGSAPATQ